MADPLLDIINGGSAPSSQPGGADPLLSILRPNDAATPAKQSAQAAQAEQPGMLASLGHSLGVGFGTSVLGAQKLVGQGLSKVGLDGAGQWLVNDADQGRAKLAAELAPYSAAHPIVSGAGDIGGSLVATLPVGGILAKGVSAIPGVANTSRMVNAIRTSGMTTGAPAATTLGGKAADLTARALGGAITGGTSAALVNQDDAGTGAAIGAALPMAGPLVPLAGKAIGKVAGGIGNGIASAVGELGTHTGAQSIKDAFASGVNGSQSFIDNLRGNVPLTDVLDAAKANVQAMGQKASQAYRSGMAAVSGDKTALDFDGIDNAVQNAAKIGAFKGQVINPQVQDKVQQAAQLVDDWKSLDSAQFHTPEGMDALKRSIGGVLESIPYEQKSARLAVGGIYNAVKDEITQQAPTYANVMKGYSDAADQIKEIERALSLGDKSSADTAMRKLQSLTRNNANTNFGNRLDLARQLEQGGGQEIMPALSGQALNTLAPRGLGKAVASGTAIAATHNPLVAITLPFQSPRLMGETAYGLGRIKGGLQDFLDKIPAGPQRDMAVQMLYKSLPVVPATIDQQ